MFCTGIPDTTFKDRKSTPMFHRYDKIIKITAVEQSHFVANRSCIFVAEKLLNILLF